jgi:flagellar biosynthetic protein FliP
MTTVTTTGHAIGHSERRNLVRHFFEMVAAMFVGMAALGGVVRMICAALGYSGFFVDHVGLRAPLMAMNMTIGMAAWMRYRGHGWPPIGEMSAAMFAPVLVLIGPFWAGVLPGGVLLAAMHVLMLPAMVIAMLHRRDEYAQDHRRHFVMSH